MPTRRSTRSYYVHGTTFKRQLRGSQGMGVVSNNWLDRVLLSILYMFMTINIIVMTIITILLLLLLPPPPPPLLLLLLLLVLLLKHVITRMITGSVTLMIARGISPSPPAKSVPWGSVVVVVITTTTKTRQSRLIRGAADAVPRRRRQAALMLLVVLLVLY